MNPFYTQTDFAELENCFKKRGIQDFHTWRIVPKMRVILQIALTYKPQIQIADQMRKWEIIQAIGNDRRKNQSYFV